MSTAEPQKPAADSVPHKQQSENKSLGGEKPQKVVPKLEGEALEHAIRAKIEYYFSLENLQTDSYLVSKMNSDLWVEIALLLQFRGLKTLGADAQSVIQALKSSKTVTVNDDKTMVRPVIKIERKTLIIRDLPANAETQEVQAIFSEFTGENAPTEVRSEVGGNWFVSFSSEERCVQAHSSLDAKRFRDQPIRARIKSETLLKSFYQPPPQVFPVYQGTNYEFDPASGQYFVPDMMYMQPHFGRGGQNRGRNGRKNGKKRRSQSQSQPLQLGPTHFPPLPTKKDLKDGEVKLGYSEPFTQYSKDELIQIFEGLENLSKPEFLVTCDIILNEADKTACSKVNLTSDERAEVFLHVDNSTGQAQDKGRAMSISMSPFVSPYFASVPSANWPSEAILTPAASAILPAKKESRALKIERVPETPVAPAIVVASEETKSATPFKASTEEEKGSFRDVLMSRKAAP
eukprot:c3547_g1_i1.p1 GENE.c3547_g1_i1~~c3547_g1_i1.p1  ORF type:complete len:460 (-),score=69.63 c3547_g1_i1:198-1577(-)